MGRPEADHDHQASSSNQAFHQTDCEQHSEKPEHQVLPPNPTHCQTYVLGRPSGAENEDHHQQQEQVQPTEHIAPRNSPADSQETQANQTHQQEPQSPYHHNVHYYFPTPNPHHGTNLTLHNFPNQYAPRGQVPQFQAMPPGLRPYPTLYPSPPPPPPLYHSQPLNNYSGSQHVQQVVLHPPPAAYNYPSSSRNPQPCVNYNNFAATGIPMMQNVQYLPLLMPQSATGEGTTWKTGLFDCLLDPPNAIMTTLCPCWTFGQIAEIVDNGQTSCSCNALIYMVIWCFIMVPCLLSCTYRRKLRNKLDLPESPGPDCIIHCLCELCALCQEHRELELRGLDPSLGWVGNMEQLQRMQQKRQGTVVVPPMTQRMTGY
ncbi:developmental and secondary metabolism regulator ve-1-like [Rosa chinensis]|nr:developmental and secondary metabolism regulator ve-1-like [Rosa chinensis]